jgi:hypothetical protein
MIMLKSKEMSQNEYEFISIDELVPENHLLRLIDKYIDLSFILEKTQSYSGEDNSRPTDPLILFKTAYLKQERHFINLGKKKLSEASQIPKNFMGFAIVGWGD